MCKSDEVDKVIAKAIKDNYEEPVYAETPSDASSSTTTEDKQNSMFSHNVRKKVIVTHWDEATDKDMFIRPNFELYIYEEYVRES